jgi:hypothetical protein
MCPTTWSVEDCWLVQWLRLIGNVSMNAAGLRSRAGTNGEEGPIW